MKLSELLCPDAVAPRLQTQTRDEVIAELVDALVKSGRISQQDRDGLFQALIVRESNGSTGFGKGVAVPHCQHQAVKQTVLAVGCSTTGLDFNALDKAPVYSVILLLSPPDDPDRHLRAMELIFQNLQRDSFRTSLRKADGVKTILSLFEQGEGQQAD